MTTATTSKLAYDDLKNSGKDISQKEKILGALEAVDAPLSGRELMQLTGLEINAISGRLNDLKKTSDVIECPRRYCSVTNKLITPVEINIDSEYFSSYFNVSHLKWYLIWDISTGRC